MPPCTYPACSLSITRARPNKRDRAFCLPARRRDRQRLVPARPPRRVAVIPLRTAGRPPASPTTCGSSPEGPGSRAAPSPPRCSYDPCLEFQFFNQLGRDFLGRPFEQLRLFGALRQIHAGKLDAPGARFTAQTRGAKLLDLFGLGFL